jgi:hypothetical protein
MGDLINFRRRYTMATAPKPTPATPEQKAFAADLSRLLTILEKHSKPKMSPDARALMNDLVAYGRARAEEAS